MRKSLLPIVCFALMATLSHAADRIGIPAEVPYHSDTIAPSKVRAECDLGAKVANFIRKYNRDVEVSDNPAEGHYVDMSITQVHAPGGGAWSGPKWMEVTGTLMKDGITVASFRAKRFSTGGAFAGFKGTCAIIGRCTKAIGKDIGEWLKDPRDGAELGDAQ